MLLPKTYYTIVKGDGDSVGKVLNGELNMSAKDYVALLANEAGLKGAINSMLEIASIVEALNEKLSLIPSPAYLATLSRALMITALKDAHIVRAHLGFVVYAGGDDILALLPTERALSCVRALRENYWAGKGGFHVLDKVIVPALMTYGRSFSLRYSHVMDPMKPEINLTIELLETKAKKKWNVFNKDTLVISKGRDQNIARLPLQDMKYLDMLEYLWMLLIAGHISSGISEDYNQLKEAANYVFADILNYVLKRNIGRKREKLVTELQQSLCGLGNRSAEEILINGLRILRVLPQ